MTSQSISSYTPNIGPDKVKIADDTFSFVSENGLVYTTHSLFLSSILHVLSFAINLLSISHITCDLNCSVTFFPSSCVFQDFQMRTTIDNGREINNLHFLDLPARIPKHLSVANHTSIWH